MSDYSLKHIEMLFNAKDGREAHDALEKLWPYNTRLDTKSRKALIEYAKKGKLGHVRKHITARLCELAAADESDLADLFLAGLNDHYIRYWAIEGAATVRGKLVYQELCNIALDDKLEISERANAIKMLARLSRQPFFRGLPSDPGQWKVENLRTEEIGNWRENGYPDGNGCLPPTVDPALKAPRTSIEKAAARLESKLLKFRSADKDNLINPRNYLSPNSECSIEQLTRQCRLPTNYLEFLARFSPWNISAYLYVPGIRANFSFYTAQNLFESQTIFTHIHENRNPDWPAQLIAIGDAWLSPVVLDLSRANGEDAPLLWSDHDEYPVKFRKCARSFTSFLERLEVTDEWREPS